MKSLESLESGTPEFQRLTGNQQNERRKLLTLVLKSILDDPSSLGLTEAQAVKFTCDILEFHLSGSIERFTEKAPGNKKRNK